MKTNKMSKIGYIAEYIFWLASVWIFYNGVVFECIPGLSYSFSQGILCAMICCSAVVGLYNTFKTKRSTSSAVVSVTVPFGIYTWIILINYFRWFIWFSLAAILIPSAIICIAVMGQRIKKRRKRNAVIIRRMGRCINETGKVTVFFMVIVLAVTAIKITIGGSLVRSNIDAQHATRNSEWTIGNKIETVNNLEESVWETLTVQEKLDTLQTVANIEMNYLGVEDIMAEVVVAPLRENTFGGFYERHNLIKIDPEHIQYAQPEEILNTVLHECRHVYQYSIKNTLEYIPEKYRNLLAYREIGSYVYGSENYGTIDYYTNPLEEDARKYAEEYAKNYYIRIENNKKKEM